MATRNNIPFLHVIKSKAHLLRSSHISSQVKINKRNETKALSRQEKYYRKNEGSMKNTNVAQKKEEYKTCVVEIQKLT